MKKAYIFLAEGFEEVEAMTPVDLLRRAGVEVTIVSVTGNRLVCGARQITVQADVLFEDADFSDADLLILPGGMPGTTHLKEHKGLAELLEAEDKNGTYLAAICAAPSVFGGLGLTEGKKASIYPGMEDALVGANVSFDPVSVDGHLVTSRGVGTAIPFALKLVELLCDAKKAEEIGKSIVFA